MPTISRRRPCELPGVALRTTCSVRTSPAQASSRPLALCRTTGLMGSGVPVIISAPARARTASVAHSANPPRTIHGWKLRALGVERANNQPA
jgi:hypothetical protein